MSQEQKNYPSDSTKIPMFGPTGSGRDNTYMGGTLPPFHKAANNIDAKHISLMPNQIPKNNYQDKSIKYFTDNKTLDGHTKPNDKLRGLIENKRQDGVIDLTGGNVATGHQIQMQNKPNSQLRPQQHPNMIPPTSYTLPANDTNGQFITQTTKSDPTHTRLALDSILLQRKSLNDQMYNPQLMQNDQYQTSQTTNQQRVVSTQTNMVHKLPTDYTQNPALYYTQQPQNMQFPSYNKSYPIQMQHRDKISAVTTREQMTGTVHTGDTLQKNNLPQVQMQHNPQYQYTKVKHQYNDNPVQNIGLNGGYQNTQQMYSVKQMENKHENIYKRMPNSIQQDAIQGRSYVQNDSVISNNFGTTHLMSQPNYGNGITAKSNQMANTQIQRTGYKTIPTLYSRQYENQNQLISTQDQQNSLKPLTTPRPTTIPDESIASQGHQFYDFNNNNTDYQDGIAMNKLIDVIDNANLLNYSDRPEAGIPVQRIKEYLKMTEVKHNFPMTSSANYGYTHQDLSTRKRPNDAKCAHVEPTKKQTILSQCPVGYMDTFGMYENSQNIGSPLNFNDPLVYEMNHTSTQQQLYHSRNLNIHQSGYQLNNNEMNQIVPTSSSLHSSPSSIRNNDSPGVDPLAKKRKDDDQDFSTKISDEGTIYNW
ncbi:hypothetical protein LOD99_12662 [Oopsacas minuta]|uniref:Uncharacterized protein n=1 Tax=Oopsacas minuta TaxID=111878 RepID=A0AAV7JD70_9METZ|nr:hypothetical protein LOD99_12662 [Oopsacas minuta]